MTFPALGDEVLTVGIPGRTPETLDASLAIDFHEAENGTLQSREAEQDQNEKGDASDSGDGPGSK